MPLLRRFPFVTGTAAVLFAGLLWWAAGLLIPGVPTTPIAVAFTLWAGVVAIRSLTRMIQSLRRGALGVDLLAVVALAATLAVGEYVAAMIVAAMLTGGEALEETAQRRARRSLDALISSAPRIAHVVDADDPVGVVDVAVDEVEPGDHLLVRSAETVPVDGVLESDLGVFDESALTGESLPAEKRGGATVLSGSVNGSHVVRMRATATAAASQYQALVALVAQAEAHQAPTVRLADRFAVPFTVVALAIGLVAGVAAGDPRRFAEVLVLATPCPLLIAAPVAFLGGMSRAARSGIVVKGGAVLETLARVVSVVFDKTGTLTTGHPEIVRVEPVAPWTADEVLGLAAAIESVSTHVLAASVVAAARTRGLVIAAASDVDEIAAEGVTATVSGRRAVLGKRSFVADRVADAVEPARLGAGELGIFVGCDGALVGTVIGRDHLRDEAREAVSRLRSLGIADIALVTGDARATAEGVGTALGITTVLAEQFPQQKVDYLVSGAPRPVVMVGDGVNDAPALAAADVGIAMGGRGASAASEAADAVILVEDVSRVATAVEISRRTVAIALQSIGVGMGLSIVCMLIAAFGVIPAVVGAGLQEVIDVLTILNALRASGSGRRSRREAPAVVASTTVAA